MTNSFVALLLPFVVCLVSICSSRAFVSHPTSQSCACCSSTALLDQKQQQNGGFFRGIQNFFEELDAFMDDASARRLGNGAAFYGKRRSNFYGENDANKKKDRSTPDPTEDYQGPSSSGYFKWVPDEDGQLRPMTRMKEKNIERNPAFWDRVYGGDKEED